MGFKPSALDEALASLPLKWQIIAMKAIAEENKRWKEGRLTNEERNFLDTVSKLGKTAAIMHEQNTRNLTTAAGATKKSHG